MKVTAVLAATTTSSTTTTLPSTTADTDGRATLSSTHVVRRVPMWLSLAAAVLWTTTTHTPRSRCSALAWRGTNTAIRPRRLSTQRGTAIRTNTIHTATTGTTATVTSTNNHHTSTSIPTVTLKRSPQSKSFRNGNVLVFTRAIDEDESTNLPRLLPGQLVHVVVPDTQSSSPKSAKRPASSPSTTTPLLSLGYGVYNPKSLYKIRFLCHKTTHGVLYERIRQYPANNPSNDAELIQLIVTYHLQNAWHTRQYGLGLPSQALVGPDVRPVSLETTTTPSSSTTTISPTTPSLYTTNTYRLVHGEGDALSGLAVDLIDNVAVVMSSASWCQVHQAAIVAALRHVLPSSFDIVWRTTGSRLRQDGYQSESNENNKKTNDDEEQDEQAMVIDSDQPPDTPVLSLENSVAYRVYPYANGQKTGVYCDQRDNRALLATLCRDKRVLDLCCYHGGFALNAILNGHASFVTGVDSSADAIAACHENVRLNEIDDDRTEFVKDDVTHFLQASFGTREYDVVVLDPPKLAPSVATLDKARRKYHGLNRDAIKVVNREKGGLFLTCTCSAAMTQKDGGQYFLNMVHGAALSASRQVRLLRVTGAAACHVQSPAAFPAGNYLTAALFYVAPE